MDCADQSVAVIAGVLDQVLAFLRNYATTQDGLKYDSVHHTLELNTDSSDKAWFKELLLATYLLEMD